MQAMLVREIGEFELIDELARTIRDAGAGTVERQSARGFRLLTSIGDDAAAWKDPSGVRVMTTDTMVEGTHFHLANTSWRDLGWKAMAVNVSDVAAMGCAPLYSLVTLGLHGDLPVDGLKEMYGGMLDVCREFGGEIVGGDIVAAPAFFVTVALQGIETEGHGLLSRGSASPADRIAVTGHVGCSEGGLRMLADGLSFDRETADHLREAHNRPSPRVDQGAVLARHGVAAAIDVSDGFLDDLRKLCEASEVGAQIRSDWAPADDFLRRAFPDDWLTKALSGGEDYELLFTAPASVLETVMPKMGVPVSVIGDIVEGPPNVRVQDGDGNTVEIENGGWDHLRRT